MRISDKFGPMVTASKKWKGKSKIKFENWELKDIRKMWSPSHCTSLLPFELKYLVMALVLMIMTMAMMMMMTMTI